MFPTVVPPPAPLLSLVCSRARSAELLASAGKGPFCCYKPKGLIPTTTTKQELLERERERKESTKEGGREGAESRRVPWEEGHSCHQGPAGPAAQPPLAHERQGLPASPGPQRGAPHSATVSAPLLTRETCNGFGTFLCDADGAAAHPNPQRIHPSVDQVLCLGRRHHWGTEHCYIPFSTACGCHLPHASGWRARPAFAVPELTASATGCGGEGEGGPQQAAV